MPVSQRLAIGAVAVLTAAVGVLWWLTSHAGSDPFADGVQVEDLKIGESPHPSPPLPVSVTVPADKFPFEAEHIAVHPMGYGFAIDSEGVVWEYNRAVNMHVGCDERNLSCIKQSAKAKEWRREVYPLDLPPGAVGVRIDGVIVAVEYDEPRRFAWASYVGPQPFRPGGTELVADEVNWGLDLIAAFEGDRLTLSPTRTGGGSTRVVAWPTDAEPGPIEWEYLEKSFIVSPEGGRPVRCYVRSARCELAG